MNQNKRKIKMVELHRAKRIELRKKVRNTKLSEEERAQAQLQLQRMPRLSSEVRVRNRCEMTGRPRAYLRKFKVCRMVFREMALNGLLPGVTKSSW